MTAAVTFTICFWTCLANLYVLGVIQQTIKWGWLWQNLKPWRWV